MKTTIFVFSGTGTSLAVANELSKELGDTTLISIAKYNQQEEVFVEDEIVGFVFPCNFGGLPHIVKDFVTRVKMDRAQYVFSIITAGGSAGRGLHILNKLMIKKGKALNYGKSIVIASNYIVTWYSGMIKSDKGKIEKNIKVSEERIKQFAQDIREEKTYVEKGSLLGYIVPHIISPKKIIHDTRPLDRDFNAGERCNGCGVCKKVCPVQNIRLVNKKPEYMHNCQRFMACMQYCPQQAIQYKGKYISKVRYYHPVISINEIAEFHK
jgi:ferredoxin